MIDDLTRSVLEQRDNIENQRNKELNSNRESYIKQLEKENNQLQNNWNELKKCVGEWILYHSVCEEDYKELNVLEDVESKIQELEGNNE